MSEQAVKRDEYPDWVPTEQNFGTRLAMVRQGMRWNLSEASRECGLGPNDWARYEQDVRPRDFVETVRAIAGRTGVDVNWLMLGEPTARPIAMPVWAVPYPVTDDDSDTVGPGGLEPPTSTVKYGRLAKVTKLVPRVA